MDFAMLTIKPIRKKLILSLEPHREVDMGEFDADVFLRSLQNNAISVKKSEFVVRRVGGVSIQVKKMAAVVLDNPVLPRDLPMFAKRIQEKVCSLDIHNYLNVFSPYRGALIYHGMPVQTCASVCAVEGFLHARTIYTLIPTVEKRYRQQLKVSAEELKPHQHWLFMNGTWEAAEGEPNYAEHKAAIDDHLEEEMARRYKFVPYNDPQLSAKEFPNLRNPFDDTLVVIDEVHPFVTKIVEKHPFSMILYEWLLTARNCRIVALSEMPLVHSIDEIAVLFNLLRGYIQVWTVHTEKEKEKPLETINYSNHSGKKWTLTRLPEHYINDNGVKRTDKILMTDEEFTETLRTRYGNAKVAKSKAFPEDTLEGVDEESFQRRTVGLTSYFRRETPVRKDRLHPVRMSSYQRKESAKVENPKSAQCVGNFAFPEEVKKGEEEDTVAQLVKMGVFTDHLEKYSPKFNLMLKNIESLKGQQVVYSRLDHFEGLRFFAEVLAQNGFEELKLVKRNGAWKVEGDKPKFIWLKVKEEEATLLHIFNKEWTDIPSIVSSLDCRILLTSSAHPLKNVEHVHVMEPFSDSVRIDQVIGQIQGKAVTAHMYLTTTQDYTTPIEFAAKLTEKGKKEDTADESLFKESEETKKRTSKWLTFMKETTSEKEARQKHTVMVGKKQVHFYSEEGEFRAIFRTPVDTVKVGYMKETDYYRLNFQKYVKKIDFFRDLVK